LTFQIKQILGSFLLVGLLFAGFFLPVAEAGIISTKQEISIGESAARQVEKQYKLVEDPVLQARVQQIGKKIAAVSSRPDLPYTFKVLDDEDVNAFALPGGFIYLFKGLTDYMVTDDELAGIISHEVTHAARRHSMAQLEKTLGMAVLLGAAFGGDGISLQMAALSAITAGYSRDDERMADRVGFEQSLQAGYNPYSTLVGLLKLERREPGRESDLFSDHPENRERIRLIGEQLIKQGVRPVAREQDGQGFVFDGAWSLPPVRVAEKQLMPLERAYFIAGNLYPLTKLTAYSPDHYILDTDGDSITIYYEDHFIVSLSPADAGAAGVSLQALAAQYVAALRQWPQQTAK
jgi:Putative Zn-dependent protease, contains TPR repeats